MPTNPRKHTTTSTEAGTTPQCPIYVSDGEDVDDSSTSERAVRGERKIKPHTSSGVLQNTNEPSRITTTAARNNNSSNMKNKIASSSASFLPSSTNNQGNQKDPPHRISVTTQVVQAADLVKEDTKNNNNNNSNQMKKKKKTRKSLQVASSLKKTIRLASRSQSRDRKTHTIATTTPARVHIDVTAFDATQDPVLEKELEEIALNGRRSGLISGTPDKAAYDIEHGKPKGWRNKRKPKPTLKQTLQRYSSNRRNTIPPSSNHKLLTATHHGDDEEEDLDRSWHGASTIARDNTSTPWSHCRTRLQALFWSTKQRKIGSSVAGLVLGLVTLGLLASAALHGTAQNRGSTPLSAAQQRVHTILTRVSGEKIVTEPGTSQSSARDWLLYEDEIVWDLDTANDEEGIVQRFALATLFFATGGADQQWVENNWLTGPACGDGEENDEKVWVGISCTSDGDIRSILLGTYRTK